MRAFELARIAAEAEKLRLRGLLGRIVTRVVLAAIASVFLLGAIGFGEAAGWYGLRAGLNLGYLASTGIMGGANLLVAVVLGILATRSSPSRTERDALAVRRNALAGIITTVSLTQLALMVLRFINARRPRSDRER